MNEPKFIIKKSKVFKQLNVLKKFFNEVSYSWKTNPKVGKILNENESCYCSIHGLNELKQVKKTKQIWYFLFAINDVELEEVLIKRGLKNFVVDNMNDLNKLINFISKNNIKINLLLRMKIRENTIFTGKHYVFGMGIDKIHGLIEKLESNKNIEEIGVHFHRKTQNVSEWNLKDEVAESLGEKYLKKIDLINIGGGLPGKYANSHDNELDLIFLKIKELKKYTDKFGVKIVIEPGRFIAAPSVKLECYITAIVDNTCFVNASIFNGMFDTIVANLKLIVKEEVKKGRPYTIKGCSPDSADILRYRVYLKNPKIGDKITFLNCGAYNYTTNFCALKEIKTEVIS